MLRKLLLSSAAAFAALPLSAHAQAAQGLETRGQSAALEEVVVTARRRAEDISKVPISISAFSDKVLEKKGVVNLQDVAKITPGLNMTPGGSRSNPFITIRGQTKGITGNLQPGVIPYVNEVPLTNYGANIPTFDVSNIQVLKGPQGTLFGRNAMGGAVLVYSNPPSHTFGGYVKGDLGSYNYRALEGAVNIPLMQDKVAVRLATQLYHDGGSFDTQLVSPYTINPATGIATPGTILPADHSFDELKGESYRVSLLLEPTDWIKNITVYDHSKIRGAVNNRLEQFFPQGYYGSAPAVYFSSPATLLSRFGPVLGQNIINLSQCGYSIVCDWRLVEQYYSKGAGREQITNIDPWTARTIVWGVTNTTTININDNTTLKNIFGYRNVDSYNTSDSDGSPLVIVDSPSQVRLRTYTEEVQLSGALFDDKLKYTLGGFYYNEAPDGPGGNSGLEVNSLFGLSHNISLTYLHNKSKALYGQVDYSLDDFIHGLTVTGGVRQTWDTVRGCGGSVTLTASAPELLIRGPHSSSWMTEQQCNTNSATPAMFPGGRAVLAQTLPKQDFDKLTYTLGFNWQITPDAMVYGTHRRGYRAGSYNTPLFDPYLGHIQAFGPEALEDWEIGTKLRGDVAGMRGAFDLAVFTGKDKDYQLPVGTSQLAGGICVPQAITAARPANCTNALLGGAPGVTISHAPATTIVNAGELTIRGFEAAGSIVPIEGLTLGAGVSFVDYKVNEVSVDPSLLALLRASGQNPPTTVVLTLQPRWTYNLDLDYVYPDKVLDSEVSLNVNYKHSDKFVSTAGGIEAPDFDVWDARLTFADVAGSGVDVSAWIKNIANNYYAAYAIGAPQSLGLMGWNVAPPRTYGVTVKYSFGD